MGWWCVVFSVLLIKNNVRQGPDTLAVGSGGVCLDTFYSSTVPVFIPVSGRCPVID